MNKENIYIAKRIIKSKIQSIPFYLCRVFSINKKKIVFCCIEGTTGYTCNPKYIAEELIRQKADYELVWLVNDTSKKFPKEIKVVRNTLWNRAYQLTTARIWIDNSRKQLEARKRKGQVYIQTWHAKLGFKPTCLDRGAAFSKIAYLVSKHDSDMIDYVLSNSKWYDDTLSTGMIYNGSTLRTGSPRCDILVNRTEADILRVRNQFGLEKDAKIIMYAPTFRGGSQSIKRTINVDDTSLDYDVLINALEKRFGGKWYVFLRLHPQLVARNMLSNDKNERLIDVSKVDDMYEILAGCDAFITDYSSAAFDAAVMKIPVFIYADDYESYEKERGSLLWNMKKLPFPMMQNNEELKDKIQAFDDEVYQMELEQLFAKTEMVEDGMASKNVISIIQKER